MYEAHAVFEAVDRHTVPVLALCAMALVGNYLWWFESLRLGFRDRAYSMPVGSLLFFLPHDATFVVLYHKWFIELDHWFPKLWWFGLCVTVAIELVFLHLLLKFGRKELAPEISQRKFTAVIGLGLLLATIAWLCLKSTMDDELFLIVFGITILWGAPFNFALMAQRRSAVGQSQLGWIGYLMMPVFYWPATMFLGAYFRSPLWIALGLAAIAGGLANLAYIRTLNRRVAAA